MKVIQFPDDADIVDICEDHVFKAVLTRDIPASRKALNGLLSAILNRRLTVMTITANEPPANSPTDRQIRYDINVNLENGELADIEMTKNPDPMEALRMEYYLARLYSGQEIKGISKGYDDLKQTWQVSLLAGKNLYQDKALVHRFEYYDKVNQTDFGGRTGIFTLELEKAGQSVGKTAKEMTGLERWAFFFQYITDKGKRPIINEIFAAEEDIAMAGEVIQGFTKAELEFFHNISKEKYQVDMQMKRYRAEQALRAEGEAEGLVKGRLEVARNLKALGIPADKIAAASGLSPEEIEGL
jgi:predicted transposase/invertase (TIGR01784 family)